MDSIGNDVVALNLINKDRTCQHRFYTKILNPAEQGLFSGEGNTPTLSFEHFVWLLWSIKESAYKYLKRLNHRLIFSPTQVIIGELTSVIDTGTCKQPSRAFTGFVSFNGHRLYFQSIINHEYIHSVVTAHPQSYGIDVKVQRVERSYYEYQSAAVRTLVLDRLFNIFPDQQLQIIKHPAGFPQIEAAGQLLTVPLSFAHHGMFVAFALYNSSASYTHKQYHNLQDYF